MKKTELIVLVITFGFCGAIAGTGLGIQYYIMAAQSSIEPTISTVYSFYFVALLLMIIMTLFLGKKYRQLLARMED